MRVAPERGCTQGVVHASSEANSVTATIAEGLLSKAPLDGCVSTRSTREHPHVGCC